ncbi:glycerol-3-phosphate responsive antiterminator [Ornithinibacillus sp. BX22]|uniref:Glycerol uptake operon antiterminator regulatory protein n=1 Tax=Ornithinibacillus hominis TaxID=2763055 RepID=A0A923L771_9BACI|nr:glycerol-3-phosphate responsive antiterminator [Ornithinibacillus hominis]MBC5637803.1 glycerol-3-phosphate responsive antiterminator [Ornithinibacillus hominis]
MNFKGQPIIPVIGEMKDVDKLAKYSYSYFAILNAHISRLKPVFQFAKQHEKLLLLDIDLVQGLKADEYATEYICQEFNPYGIISTKPNVIMKAKQKGVQTFQRIFLLDSKSIERSSKLIERTDPDYIELLPGVVPKIIRQFNQQTNKEIIASGFIETIEEVQQAIDAGATTITTSSKELWDYFNPNPN